MAEVIRKIIFAMNGAFLPKEGNYIDETLKDFKDSVYGDLEMSHPINDRMNMRQDVNNVRSDFKKAVKKYKDDVLNG